jgi:hypothetical protein
MRILRRPPAAELGRYVSTLTTHMIDPADPLAADFHAFIAELERVCPEAVDGLAYAGPPLSILTLRQRVDLLRQLPDDAGVEAFVAAWQATGTGDDKESPIADGTPNRR